MKNSQKIRIVAQGLILLMLIVAPFYIRSLRAQDTGQYKFSVVDSLYWKQIEYHNEMNEFFNKKMAALINKEGETKAPKTEQECNNNVSSFCVAMEATDRFIAYKKALMAERKDLSEAVGDTKEDILQIDIFARQAQKIRGIDNELAEAEKVLDLTINAYNELAIAYPLHLQYQEMLKNLEVYRSNLQGVRGATDYFKKLFVDASTTKCF